MTVEGKRLHNPKYQVFYDEKCKYRFHLNAKNSEIIAQSEGYESKEGCLNGVDAVKNSCTAEIEDLSKTQKSKDETVFYDEIEEPAVEVKAPEVVVPEVKTPEVTVPMVKASEVQVPAPVAVAEPKVEMPQPVAVPPVEMAEPAFSGPVQTVLDLQSLPMANKGEMVSFKGKLFRSDNGKGIPRAKIDVYERDRSLLGDDYLAYGNTAEDGTFSIDWKSRSLAWWDDTGQIYARFKGNEKVKPAKSTIQPITIK